MRQLASAAVLAASASFLLPPSALHAQGGAGTLSNLMNPAISANALLLGQWSSAEPEEESGSGEDGHGHEEALGQFEAPASGLSLQEIEVRLTGAVDSYFTGDLTVAVHDGEFEIEEGYVRTLGLPAGLQARAGKFLLPFGKHNTLHTHAWPFINAPLANMVLLGGEGLGETGAELSWLAPVPWYLELSAGAVDGSSPLFAPSDSEELAWQGHVKNVLDLSDAITLELGGSGITGRNSNGDRTTAAGADATLKWIPVGQELTRALILQAEWIRVLREQPGDDWRRSGAYALAQCRFMRGWWVQGRYDWLEDQDDPWPSGEAELHDSEEEVEENVLLPTARASILAAYAPTEFSALRLQYDRTFMKDVDDEDAVALQLNVTWGAHPAHTY